MLVRLLNRLTGLLVRSGARQEDAQAQAAMHARAEDAFGALRLGADDRSARAREIVRARVRARHAG